MLDELRDALDSMHGWGMVLAPKGGKQGVAILDLGSSKLVSIDEAARAGVRADFSKPKQSRN